MNSTQYSFVSSSINSLKLVCFPSAMAHGCIKSSHMCHLTEGDDVVHRVSKVDKFCDGEALASLIRFGRCFKKCQSFYNLFYVAHVCLSCCKLECVSLQRQEQDVVILHVLLVCYKHCHIRCCICVMRFYWDLLRVVNIYCFPIYFLPIWCSRNVAKKNYTFYTKQRSEVTMLKCKTNNASCGFSVCSARWHPCSGHIAIKSIIILRFCTVVEYIIAYTKIFF
jgi:hypothetical protein